MTRPRQHSDDRARALIQFASEEAKHIQLFKRFREEFDAGFGHHCEVIGPPEAVAAKILSYSPLAVALLTLHIEWFVQAHYLESVKDDQTLDPQFKSLLKHHWMEEAQHTKLDTLMVEELAAAAEPEDIARAVDEYLETSAPGVFCCGDMGRGQSLIVWAIAEGRSCAAAVDQYLQGETRLPVAIKPTDRPLV